MNLIFDFSGTLAEENELPWKLTAQTIEALGGKPLDRETYRREFSLPVGPFYARYLPGIPLETIESTFAQLAQSQYGQGLRWVEGLVALLPRLAARHRLFLFSTLDAAVLREALTQAGLQDFFQSTQGGVGDKRESLPLFIAKQDLHPDDTVYIGDTTHDMEAAAASHIGGWAVTWGHGAAKDLSALTEVVLNSVSELEKEITKKEIAAARAFPLATVGALLIDDSGHVLMVKTRKWLVKWGIPGGKIDYGETVLAALTREVREETGLQVQAVRWIQFYDAIESPEFYRPRHFLLLNFAARVAGVKPVFVLNHEGVEGEWFALDAALKLDLNAPTLALLHDFSRQGGWEGLQSPSREHF
jgi:phosphoglycolate phosphatase